MEDQVAPFGCLSEKDCGRIHDLAQRLLERIGVGVESAASRQALTERGARVDPATHRVHLPEGVVRDLLAGCPPRVSLGARRGASHTAGPDHGPCLWPGNALYLVDGAQRRLLGGDDFARLTRLVDRLANVHAMVGVAVSQFPPPVRDFCTLRLMARHTGKHLRPVITSMAGIDAVLEMAEVLDSGRGAGGPGLSFGYSITSPLHWGATAMRLMEGTSGRGLPFMANSEPLAGGTSPVTLAGSVAQAHAETLSGIALAQALEPGRPCFHNAGFAHTLDMRTAVALGGSPEVFLMGAAASAMARHCGLPCASWVSTESMVEDGQAAAEKSLGLLLHARAGVNLVWGMGQLESQMSVSAEQLVIDDEIAAQVLRLREGMCVDDDHLAAEVLLAGDAGHGDLLAHPHTLQWFRAELSQLRLANRERREKWQARGAADLRQRARAAAAELLAAPWEPCLTHEEDRELERIESAWRRRLAS